MKKGFAILSVVAFLVAVAGVIIAIAAYFKNKDFLSCCCDDEEDFMDFDDEELDYFSADMVDEPEFEAEIVYEEPVKAQEAPAVETKTTETAEAADKKDNKK